MTNKEKFIEIAANIKRDGIEQLLSWIEKTDFYLAPASTRNHLPIEGGLVQHTLNVNERLLKLYTSEYGKPSAERLETIAIISLFHDLCKINCYRREWRNVKVFSDDRKDFKWESQEVYVFDEQQPFGYHGPKSAFLVERFMRLTEEEYICIANHMGAYDRPQNDYTLQKVFEKNHLAFLLHTADCFASLVEKGKIKG